MVIRKELKEEPMFRCSQQRWLRHLVRMPPGEEFWACPSGMIPWDRARTVGRNYVFHVAWDCLEELIQVGAGG